MQQLGVGTVSFYNPQNRAYAALGHGIIDNDTGKLINIEKGSLVSSNIVSIKKGEIGNPGEIKGSISLKNEIGTIEKNSEFGIFGKLKNEYKLSINKQNLKSVAKREEIQEGDATILCTIEDNKTKEYNVKIKKVYSNNYVDNKSMLIEVVDEELLEETGGIIRGLSGAPILQNNKVVGAVTHVFVANPNLGYGVFADMMIKNMNEVQ